MVRLAPEIIFNQFLIIAQRLGELCKRFRQLLVIGSYSMPVVIVLHEVDALAHDGVHHDGDGFTLSRETLCFFKRSNDFIHIVAVHFKRGPSKSVEFRMNISEVHDGFGSAIDLLTIPIHGGNEVVYFLAGGKHDGFPVLSFVQFSITMEREYNIFVVIEFFT